MRIFRIQGDQLTELSTLPDAAPTTGYLWIGVARAEFERNANFHESRSTHP